MKAMLIDGNQNLVWSEVADPVISDTQVMIEVYAAAVMRKRLPRVNQWLCRYLRDSVLRRLRICRRHMQPAI